MKNMQQGRRFAIIAALALMALLYWFSSISNLVYFQEAPLPDWAAWLVQHFRISWGSGGYFSYGFNLHPDYLLHKAGHITLYGLLGLSLYFATGRSLRWTLLLVTGFAFSDEWHQSLVPGRDGRFFDVVLDVVSAWGFVKLLKIVEMKGMTKE